MNKIKLIDLTIDKKGHYGLGASACSFNANYPLYLRITDIDDNSYVRDLPTCVNPNEYLDYKNFLLSSNDIVFARTGNSTGRNYFYDGKFKNVVFAGFLIKYALDPNKVVPKYVSYYCQSQKYKAIIESLSNGSTRKNLNANQFGEIEIPIYPSNMQQHIVNIIGSIDDLIELNNKLVLKLLSILNNKLEYLITKSTEFIPLKSIISERKERIGLNDVKLLSVVNTGELVLQDEYFDKNTASADMKKYKLIRKFDYAYNPARINIGSIGMLKENYLGAISPIYVVFEIDENYKYYLDFYKSSKYMRKYIEKKSSGSVRQNLPFDEFASIEIPNINTEFLKEFNSLCDLYYKKINDLKTKTIKLQAIKDQYLKKFFG